MKRFNCILAALVLCICMAGTSLVAYAEDMDTLADWGISVAIPDNSSAILDGTDGCFYIYPQESGVIPYVMLYVYDGFADEADFAENYLFDMMAANYSDLEIVSDWGAVTYGSRDCYEVDFTYTVSGYQVFDRRVVLQKNGRTYVFTSKEVEELGKTVGTLLEDTVSTCVFEGEEQVEVGYPEDNEIKEVTWDDVLGWMEGMDLSGSFVPFEEIGLQLFIPDDFLPVEIDEEMKDAYYLGLFTPDEESWTPSVALQYVDDMDFSSFEDYKELVEAIADSGMELEFMGEVYINGIQCLMYQIPEEDLVVIGTEINGGALEITMFPFSDDSIVDTFEIIAGSIMEIGAENGSDVIIPDDGGDDIVIEYDPTQNNLADLLQDLLDSLQNQN